MENITNAHFKTSILIKTIRKKFKVSLSAQQIYAILKFNKPQIRTKAIIKNKSKESKEQHIIRSIEKVKNTIKKINKNNDDNVIFIDEVHIDLADINSYGWNEK